MQPRSTFSKRSTGLIINTLGDLSAQLQPHIDSIHSDLARLGSAHAWERPAIGSSIYASLSSCHQAVVSCGSTTPPPPPPRPSNAPAPPSSPYYGNSDIVSRRSSSDGADIEQSNAAGIAANIVRSVHSCTVAVGSVLHQIPQMELSFTHIAQELDCTSLFSSRGSSTDHSTDELTSYLGSCERQIPGLLAMTSSNCGEYIRFYSHSMMYSKLWGGPSLQPYNTECHFGSLFELLGHKRLGW